MPATRSGLALTTGSYTTHITGHAVRPTMQQAGVIAVGQAALAGAPAASLEGRAVAGAQHGLDEDAAAGECTQMAADAGLEVTRGWRAVAHR